MEVRGKRSCLFVREAISPGELRTVMADQVKAYHDIPLILGNYDIKVTWFVIVRSRDQFHNGDHSKRSFNIT